MKSTASNLWVVNASPLILLAKIGRVGLLTQLSDRLVVPQAVWDEVMAGPDNDPARLFLSTKPIEPLSVTPDPQIVQWDLGAGETAVLSYARQNLGWRVVVDDGAARRCAETLGLPLAGTLAIVIAAKQKGLVPMIVPILQQLLLAGYRIDEAMLRRVLPVAVGEQWPPTA